MEFTSPNQTDGDSEETRVEILVKNYEEWLASLSRQMELPRRSLNLTTINEEVVLQPTDADVEPEEVIELAPVEPEEPANPEQVVQSLPGIKHIVAELMSNEAIYVETLSLGIQNYVQPMDDPALSDELREAKCEIFGNIKDIHRLHATAFYPALQSCDSNVTQIAETFTNFVKYGDFYCYVLFMLSRERALLLCDKYRDFFDELQTKCKDRLGVSSFLLQPIQRLPRYQLLLTEVIKELAKQKEKMDVKPFVRTVCLAEKTVERLLVLSNESLSINEIVRDDLPVDPLAFGQFRKMGTFTIYERDSQRQYTGKLFYFDQILIYTESRDQRLEYRGHYLGDEFGICEYDANKKLCLFAGRLGEREVEFSTSIQQLGEWHKLLLKALMDFTKAEKRKLGRRRTYIDAGRDVDVFMKCEKS